MADTEPQAAAAKVLWHFTMSLDGFVAGPEHDMHWLTGVAVRPGLIEEYTRTTGAVLAGRDGFDSAIGDARPYGGAWQGPVFVLTHHPEDARPADGITILSCPVEEAVQIALDAAGGKNVEVFSPTIGRQLLERGLIDEIDLHIAPILLGAGIPLYDNPADDGIIRLHRVGDGDPASTVNVRYRPVTTGRSAARLSGRGPGPRPRGDPVLRQVAEGVLIHQSEFCQSNAVVVHGRAGVLLIDPGVHGYEMAALANDLSDSSQTVAAGFSTHPHWDHLLWHARLGAAPRYGTARCAATARDWLSDARAKARIAEQVPLDLLGLITGLPAETARIPWDGPQVRIIEHQAHAPGHAALLIEERGVLVAGDMLSDVLIPMLDLNDTADPIEDYLAALRLLEGAAGDVDVLVPGHGSIGGADQVHARIDQDRAYVHALRDAGVPSDPRVGPSATYGKDWVPGVHARQLQRLARRSERDGTPG